MTCDQNCKRLPDIHWPEIDTVLLDMDGTLLDKHFDDYFWEQYVPEHYSLMHGLSVEEARQQLLARYQRVENTLDWTDLDYWSRELGLDIVALKLRINHLIGIHPYVIEFLEFCLRMRKKLYLVTNAHSKTLAIKLKETSLSGWFDDIVCSQDLGLPKETPEFWPRLAARLEFDPKRALLADDTEKVLEAARAGGIGHLVYVARPSSRKPVRYSKEFPSIVYFKELMTES